MDHEFTAKIIGNYHIRANAAIFVNWIEF